MKSIFSLVYLEKSDNFSPGTINIPRGIPHLKSRLCLTRSVVDEVDYFQVSGQVR